LNVIQELWDIIDDHQSESSSIDYLDRPTEQLLVAISVAAMSGIEAPKTLKLGGIIQGLEVLILLDSGSSHSFICASVASLLNGVTPMISHVQVIVANGQLLQSDDEIIQATRFIQGHEFQSDLKVLDLHNFDMIIGIEWLERFSTMHIHWAHKWISIPYQGKHITLQGHMNHRLECHMVELVQISSESDGNKHAEVPEVIKSLLQQFQYVFDTPSALPPRRACGHKIPPIPGATLVHIRPYRYAPALKDEIEK
jgi:hypothetical protein